MEDDIGRELFSLDGLSFQQRSKVVAETVVKNNRVFVVVFYTQIMSVGPSVVKICCQV